MTWQKPREYVPGDLFITGTGRTVEIVAADEVTDADEWGEGVTKVSVIAYTFVGGSVVHIRAARDADQWTKIEGD